MRHLVLPAFALTALLLTGCNPSEEDFPDAYGGAVCSKLKRCDKADYQQTYDDKAECVDDWAAVSELFLNLGGFLGAEYSPSLAGDCLWEIRSASCAEFDDGQYDCEVFE